MAYKYTCNTQYTYQYAFTTNNSFYDKCRGTLKVLLQAAKAIVVKRSRSIVYEFKPHYRQQKLAIDCTLDIQSNFRDPIKKSKN